MKHRELRLFRRISAALSISGLLWVAVPDGGTAPALNHESPGEPGPGFDIVLLMDSSGSMKKTDPGSYRKQAARLLASLFGKNDRIGIVGFGDSARLLLPLTENVPAEEKNIVSAINRISSDELSTNIQLAVKRGFEELKPVSGRSRVLILMSDGKLALGSQEKDQAALRELYDLLPQLEHAGIKLYAVAFTGQADEKLLEDIARKTGGFFHFAESDKDVHVMFSSLFEKIKSPDMVPLDGESFVIDSAIKEAVVLITKKAGTKTALIDPSYRRITEKDHGDLIHWYDTDVFDMITLTEPLAGKWRVNLSSFEGNRIYVITNLNLRSSLDTNFANPDSKIRFDVWFERDGGIIKEEEVLDQITFRSEITGPEGRTEVIEPVDSWSAGNAAPGMYTYEFKTRGAGDYAVRIAAESKTFKREKILQFKVAAPPLPPKERENQAVQTAGGKKAGNDDVSWAAVVFKLLLVNILLAGAGLAFFRWRPVMATVLLMAQKKVKEIRK